MCRRLLEMPEARLVRGSHCGIDSVALARLSWIMHIGVLTSVKRISTSYSTRTATRLSARAAWSRRLIRKLSSAGARQRQLPPATSWGGFRGAWNSARARSATARFWPIRAYRQCATGLTSSSRNAKRSGRSRPRCSRSGPPSTSSSITPRRSWWKRAAFDRQSRCRRSRTSTGRRASRRWPPSRDPRSPHAWHAHGRSWSPGP